MRQTALVTGASSGIGRALVVQLTGRGLSVVASGRKKDLLAELAEQTGCFPVVADLSDPGGPRQLYRQTCRLLGGAPDFLINNAGYNSRKAAWVDVTDEELDEQYRVNLRVPAILCREALRDMCARGSGHVVNVGSTAVLHGCETMGCYSTMKHGLSGLTRVLIKEARPHGVKVTLVHPGGTDTGFRAADRPDYLRPESAAHMLCDALFSPADVVVHELTFRPLVETNF